MSFKGKGKKDRSKGLPFSVYTPVFELPTWSVAVDQEPVTVGQEPVTVGQEPVTVGQEPVTVDQELMTVDYIVKSEILLNDDQSFQPVTSSTVNVVSGPTVGSNTVSVSEIEECVDQLTQEDSSVSSSFWPPTDFKSLEDLFDIIMETCTCCRLKLIHCPLCPTTIFKPTRMAKVRSHLTKSHWNYRVKCALSGTSAVPCQHLLCNFNGRHYHCPSCKNKIIRRSRNFMRHLAEACPKLMRKRSEAPPTRENYHEAPPTRENDHPYTRKNNSAPLMDGADGAEKRKTLDDQDELTKLEMKRIRLEIEKLELEKTNQELYQMLLLKQLESHNVHVDIVRT